MSKFVNPQKINCYTHINLVNIYVMNCCQIWYSSSEMLFEITEIIIIQQKIGMITSNIL